MSTAAISPSKSVPTLCSPNLMPFHINYSGPAPVSTYLLVKPGLANPGAPPEGGIAEAAATEHPPTSDDTNTVSPISVVKRFVAAFRGRTMHGVDVPLPDGYTGLVLRGDAPGTRPNTHADTRSSRKQRENRGTKAKMVEADEDSMGVDGNAGQDEEPVRTLKPAAQFPSLVLWHPDIPVDDGKDEYLRSLSEWIDLAAEIHRVEAA